MVCFDLFGVLISEGHLISNVLSPLLPASCKQSQLRALYNEFNLANITEQAFWQGLEIDDVSSIRNIFLRCFQLDEDYEKVIQALQPHYQLSILSNLPADWADWLVESFRFDQHFSPRLFSGHTRCKKPEKEIYQKLIDQSGLEPAQIIFIDDRLENLKTAKSIGMNVVYYQREEEPFNFSADATIHRLGELLLLLKHGA